MAFAACLSLLAGEFAKKDKNRRRSSHEKSHIRWSMAAGHCINRENSNILYIIKRALPPEDSQRKKYEKENSYLYLSISLADVYIIMKKCFRFVFRLLKKCESWKRKVLMQFLSVIDKEKGEKEAKMNFIIQNLANFIVVFLTIVKK